MANTILILLVEELGQLFGFLAHPENTGFRGAARFEAFYEGYHSLA